MMGVSLVMKPIRNSNRERSLTAAYTMESISELKCSFLWKRLGRKARKLLVFEDWPREPNIRECLRDQLATGASFDDGTGA